MYSFTSQRRWGDHSDALSYSDMSGGQSGGGGPAGGYLAPTKARLDSRHDSRYDGQYSNQPFPGVGGGAAAAGAVGDLPGTAGDAHSFFGDLTPGAAAAQRARARVVDRDSDTVSVLSQDDTASLASFSYLA